jgi:PAS domain S-box-containing protein
MRTTLAAIFAALATFLVVSVGTTYWIGNQRIHNEREAGMRRSTVDQLNIVLSTLKDAETGQRGYLLTLDQNYLAPFEEAQGRITKELARLAQGLDSQERSNSDFSQLVELSSQKLNELRETIDLARHGNFDKAVEVVRSDRGKLLMDRIRDRVSRIKGREESAVEKAQRSLDRIAVQRNAIFSAMVVVNLAFIFWAYRKIRHEAKIRAEARIEVERQKELLSVTLMSIGDAVIVTDVQGQITAMNNVAEALTGWSWDDAKGAPCEAVFKIINQETRQPVESPVTRVIREGVIANLANHSLLIRRDGSEIPIDDSGAPIRESDGTLRGVVLIFRDFTEPQAAAEKLRTARDELNAANKAKDYFLAILSHELRTPLGAILGWANLLRESPEDKTIVLQGVEVVQRNAAALSELISDLLDISKITSGTLTTNFAEVDLKQLVSLSVQALSVQAACKGIVLRSVLEIPEGMTCRILGDEVRPQQILENILGNALKFTPEGGTVTVHLSKDQAMAILVVKDTGIGISRAFLPHVFEPFVQAEASTKSNHGMGLGLAICKHLVELYDGSISVESDGPGRGATFTVKFPLMASKSSLSFEAFKEHAFTEEKRNA